MNTMTHEARVHVPDSPPPGRGGDRPAEDHVHVHEPQSVPAAPNASVALDIGPGRGALVIYPHDRFRGREIEISREEGEGPRVHTGVHERQAHSGRVLTAIFGSLPAGEYAVWEDAQVRAGSVAVPPGTVAEFHLR